MAEEINQQLLANFEDKRNENDKENHLGRKIWNESRKMWVIAAPAIFTRFTTFGTNVITQAFVRHIGEIELAAYSLTQTVLLRFGNSIFLGMASGLETLCGQAYGAQQYHMLGIYLQRSWIILTMSTTVILPLFIFASPLLKALGQDKDIAKEAGNISLWLIPVVYSFIFSFTCQMFLQAQSKNMIITYLAILTLLIHVFLSWLLTVKYNYGIPGAMISMILAFWIPNVGQLLFIFNGGCQETWKGFSSLAFKDLIPIARLSLASGAMICLELWYYAILLLLTGTLKNAETAIDALSICLNINGWEMMISIGFLAAAGVRVANELGSGSASGAKFSIWVPVLTLLGIGFVLFIFFLFYRERLAYIFTTSRDVAIAVDDLSTLLAFSILLNSVQPVLSEVAIGAGWQSSVAYVNVGCYYLIGVPIGAILGYVFNFKVKGVWSGMLIGTLMQTIVLFIITLRTDWNKQVSDAKQRVNRWFVQSETETENCSQSE